MLLHATYNPWVGPCGQEAQRRAEAAEKEAIGGFLWTTMKHVGFDK